jgi:hypothetical protein
MCINKYTLLEEMRDAILRKYAVKYPGSLSHIFVLTGYTLKNSVVDPDPYDLSKIERNLYEKSQYFILFNDYCLFDSICFFDGLKNVLVGSGSRSGRIRS